MNELEKRIKFYQEELLMDLQRLVQIASVRDVTSVKEDAPFGDGIRCAMDAFLDIAKRCGFTVHDVDGYAVYANIEDRDDYIGVLAHLDVVEAGDLKLWDSDPFTLVQKGDMLYGRGVNDDKGPLLAALYAARLLKEEGISLKHDIRIIAGGAEETTWECMEHYFAKHKQPVMGFSPDGNFPIVNGEKGILQYELVFSAQQDKEENMITHIHCEKPINYVCDHIELHIRYPQKDLTAYAKQADSIRYEEERAVLIYRGRTSLSRNPQRGENALWKLCEDLCDFPFAQHGFHELLQYIKVYLSDDFYGEKSGLYHEDEEMGKTSICPMALTMEKDTFRLRIDYRYIHGVDIAKAKEHIKTCAKGYHADFAVLNEKRMLYVPQTSPLIRALKAAYKQAMHEEAEVFTKGGASYARTLDCGVAFGATFEGEDPRPHMPNEQMPLSSLLKACEIYYYALKKLACDEE